MRTVHPMTLALEWAARGIPAFPVEIHLQDGRVQKRPLTKYGHRDASVDIDTVRDMFVQAYPRNGGELACGLVPGAGGFIVLDPDVKDGQDGPGFADSLGIPDGWLVITASGGQHRWFSKPDPEVRYSNATPPEWHGLIDIRADNGWVVAPGTVTEHGTWAPAGPWPLGGPPVAPEVVRDALRTSGDAGEPSEAHRAGRMTEERRGEIHAHTLAVYDYMVLNHGAHDPQIMTRVGEEPYLTVCRPGKTSGISATIGFAAPGALFVWSSSWAGLPLNETVYPMGRDQDLLGATAPAISGAVVENSPPGVYFVRGALQVATVVAGVMSRVPVAVDRSGGFWLYDAGVWRASRGSDLIAETMYAMLGQQFRAGQVDSVTIGVRAEASRISPDEPNPKYVNVLNGMLDWQTGDLLGHAPDYHSVNQLPVLWDPGATCHLFDRFIRDVLPPDLTTPDYGGVAFVDLLLGYLITSGNPHHLAVLLLGSGSNGKSVFIDVVQALLGLENVSSVALRDLDENRFRAAGLYAKLANICGDLDNGRLDGTAMFKKVTSGDLITAEHKYGQSFEFKPYAVPLFSANEVFGTPDTSDGYFRRWLPIPFPNRFEGEAKDTTLGARIIAGDLPGILARAVRGARVLATLRGLPSTPSTEETLDRFKRESDPIRAFRADCMESAPGHSVTQKEAYEVYRIWAAQNGRGELASARFGSRLEESGVTRGTTMGKKMLRGQRLTVRPSMGDLEPLLPAGDSEDPLAGLLG